MRTYVVGLVLALMVGCGNKPMSDVEICKRAMDVYYKGKDAPERAVAADRLRCEEALKGTKWVDVHVSKLYRCWASVKDVRDSLLCEKSADAEYTCATINAQPGHEKVDCTTWSRAAVGCYLENLEKAARMEHCDTELRADAALRANEDLKKKLDDLQAEADQIDKEYSAALEAYKTASDVEKKALDEKLIELQKRKAAFIEAARRATHGDGSEPAIKVCPPGQPIC
jgi:hypothetical protein